VVAEAAVIVRMALVFDGTTQVLVGPRDEGSQAWMSAHLDLLEGPLEAVRLSRSMRALRASHRP